MHVAECVIRAFPDADRVDVGAAAAEGIFCLGSETSELTCRTDVHTCTTCLALSRLHVEWGGDLPVHTSSNESDRFRAHLLLAHPHAETTQDAVVVLWLKAHA